MVNYIKILGLDTNIDQYEPIATRSFIDLAAKIKQKKAFVNPINEDNVSDGLLQQQYIHQRIYLTN